MSNTHNNIVIKKKFSGGRHLQPFPMNSTPLSWEEKVRGSWLGLEIGILWGNGDKREMCKRGLSLGKKKFLFLIRILSLRVCFMSLMFKLNNHITVSSNTVLPLFPYKRVLEILSY